MNENGQWLLEMCSYYNLCVSNTFFSTKPCHRVSWKHPRSDHWHQLDLMSAITRRSSLNSVLITRTYHSADCDSDHSLIISKVRLKPKQLHWLQTKRSTPQQHCSYISLPATRKVCRGHRPGSSCIPLQQCRREMELPPRYHLQHRHRHLWKESKEKPGLVQFWNC